MIAGRDVAEGATVDAPQTEAAGRGVDGGCCRRGDRISAARATRRGAAHNRQLVASGKMERAMRIELTTYSLGSCRSATELRPHYQ